MHGRGLIRWPRLHQLLSRPRRAMAGAVSQPAKSSAGAPPLLLDAHIPAPDGSLAAAWASAWEAVGVASNGDVVGIQGGLRQGRCDPHPPAPAVLLAQPHAYFSRSVVPIIMYPLKQENPNNPTPSFAIPGIVTVCGTSFCHIITCNGFLFSKQDEYRYEVAFPNGATIDLESIVVERHDQLAAFYCDIAPGIVDAVQFGNHTTRNQKLKMYSYDINDAKQLVKDVTDGYLTHVGEDYIAHDCTPSLVSHNGLPFFSEERQLVGISYKFAGVTKALNVKHITAVLSGFYEGMNNRPLSVILRHIRDVREQRSA